jgi:hypothetical protein
MDGLLAEDGFTHFIIRAGSRLESVLRDGSQPGSQNREKIRRT